MSKRSAPEYAQTRACNRLIKSAKAVTRNKKKVGIRKWAARCDFLNAQARALDRWGNCSWMVTIACGGVDLPKGDRAILKRRFQDVARGRRSRYRARS